MGSYNLKCGLTGLSISKNEIVCAFPIRRWKIPSWKSTYMFIDEFKIHGFPFIAKYLDRGDICLEGQFDEETRNHYTFGVANKEKRNISSKNVDLFPLLDLPESEFLSHRYEDDEIYFMAVKKNVVDKILSRNIYFDDFLWLERIDETLDCIKNIDLIVSKKQPRENVEICRYLRDTFRDIDGAVDDIYTEEEILSRMRMIGFISNCSEFLFINVDNDVNNSMDNFFLTTYVKAEESRKEKYIELIRVIMTVSRIMMETSRDVRPNRYGSEDGSNSYIDMICNITKEIMEIEKEEE
jgi:hypothetical protein